MTKSILRLLLLTVITISNFHASFPLLAYDFTSGNLYYNILSEEDKTVEVTYKTIDHYDYISGNLIIPSTVTNDSKTYLTVAIGDEAFEGCKELYSVTIPNSVTSIGEYAFFCCAGLTTVGIPNSVTTIKGNAFAYCEKLTSVDLPNSVSFIGKRAFRYSGLTSVIIPNSLSKIDEYVFDNCYDLVSVTFPTSEILIWSGAFYANWKLTTIYCMSSTPPQCANHAFVGNILQKVTLYVPKGTKPKYQSVDPWRDCLKIEEMDFGGSGDMADDDSMLQISVVDGVLTIGGIGGNEAVAIYDMQGRMMYRGTERVISDLAPGIYVAKISNKTAKFTI